MKKAMSSIVAQYLKLKSSVKDLQNALYRSQNSVETLTDRLIEAHCLKLNNVETSIVAS
jgi:hypothetical protein